MTFDPKETYNVAGLEEEPRYESKVDSLLEFDCFLFE